MWHKPPEEAPMITYNDTSAYLVDIELDDPDGRQFVMNSRAFVIGSFDAGYYDESVFTTHAKAFLVNTVTANFGVGIGQNVSGLIVGRTHTKIATTQTSAAMIVGGIRPRMDNLSFAAFVIET